MKATMDFRHPALGVVRKGEEVECEPKLMAQLAQSGKLEYATKVIVTRPLVGPESDVSSSPRVRRRKTTRSKRSEDTDES